MDTSLLILATPVRSHGLTRLKLAYIFNFQIVMMASLLQFPTSETTWCTLTKLTVLLDGSNTLPSCFRYIQHATSNRSIANPNSLQVTYSAGSEADFPANPPDQPTYVLANGDTDGSSIHGDFMNGWKPGALQQVIDKCSDLGFGNTANCPVLKSALGKAFDQEAAHCRYELSIPNEEIGLTKAIEFTPGNNALSDGTTSASGPPKAPLAVIFVQAKLFVNTSRPGGWPIA